MNDRSDATHSPGCADTGLGTCTLRDAILFANSHQGPDTILFGIPGPGVHSIQPTSLLPPLTDDAGVFIDGFSQPGASPNTAAQGSNAVWAIAIDAGVSAAVPALSVRSSGNIVRGLLIANFAPSIEITAGFDNAVFGNQILDGGISVYGSARRVAIGSVSFGDRNILLGAGGVWISGLGVGEVTAAGNIIGAFPSESTGTYWGIRIANGADHNVIGGSTAGAGNVISGCLFTGIDVIAGASDNLIEGNFIGTDPAGMTAIPNQSGISLNGSGNTVGGATPGSGNVISGNTTWGVVISGSNNVVAGNLIGSDKTGANSLGNGRSPYLGGGGVFVGSPGSGNRIGGLTSSEGNVIAFNGNVVLGGPGIAIGASALDPSLHNSVLGNSIHDNFGLGIDLGLDGVTPNHPCGSASGPNLLQNYPEIQSVSVGQGAVVVVGRLDSRPSETYSLEFFANRRCSPLGNGEGELFLGRATVTTGQDCTGAFQAELPVSLPPGAVVTATATDSNGNTSEFSACRFGTQLYTVPPCRLVDTRAPDSPFGGPALVAGADRSIPVTDSCGIPETAKSVAYNVAVVSPTGPGFFTLYPGGTKRPLFSTINYSAGQIRANNGIIALGESGGISIFCGQGSGQADVVIDVVGYFQ